MAWWKRYEPLLEQKPVSGAEAVKDLIAKELVELWQTFPPEESSVAFEDAALERRLKGRLHELPPLDGNMVELVAQLVVWDLAHDLDAIDHHFRNHHHRRAAPTAAHVDALHLLWRGVLEHLYARKEEAGGILKSQDLREIVERARTRFVKTRERTS